MWCKDMAAVSCWCRSWRGAALQARSAGCARSPAGRDDGPMSDLNEYLSRSAAAINAMIERDLSAPMAKAIDAIVTALAVGKPLLVCGNGGSAADAIHIAGELVGRFLRDRKAYNVIA